MALIPIGLIVVLAFASGGALGADWPQFLGPQRNGSYPDPEAAFSLSQPRLLWKKEIGAGFSGPVVTAGKLILFHRIQNSEVGCPGSMER